MNRLGELWNSYHPIVWWIVAGTMLTRFTSFMVMPFMALYMKLHTHASTGTIGLTIGCAALTSMGLGLVGGSLSDKFGRKRVMVVAMILNVIVMVGYASARSVTVFFVLSISTGLTRIMFEPAAQALLTEVTSVERRSSVFALRYWAINVGAAAGPIIGGYFGTVATGWTFYLSALANLLYLFVVLLVFPNKQSGGSSPTTFSFRQVFQTVAFDRALLLFLLAAFLSNMGYSQIETTLAQKMAMSMSPSKAAAVFGMVLSSNAIVVVFLQLPISKWTRRMGIVVSMMVGQGIFALGYLAFGYASGLETYLGAMVVLTFGEIIVFPQNSEYMSLLAPTQMRASYFGARSMAQLGFFLGPWLGGWALPHIGGRALFVLTGIVVALGIPFYRWSNSWRLQQQSSATKELTCL